MTICNKCGRVLDIWDQQEDFTIKKRLGYGTKYDGEDLDLSMCCDCMEQIIDNCLIPPFAEKAGESD